MPMPHIRAQRPSKLATPMLILALLAGAVMGALGGGLLVLPDLIASAGDPDIIETSLDTQAYNGWGGPTGYFLIPVLYGILCGMFLALIAAAGSFIGLAIQDKKQPARTGNDQAVAAGAGAAVAGVLLALFVIWIIGEGLTSVFVIGPILMTLCFIIAQLALIGILRFIDKRDPALREAI